MLTGLSTWALPAWAHAQRDEPAGPAPMAPAVAGYIAAVLGRLIDTTRQQAIADGVQPVPVAVSRSLTGFFPPALLQKTRFTSGPVRPLSLPALSFTYGDAIAMTVGDVVLFRSDRRAQSDLKTWAHELTHVMQYQRWGIQGFAERYVRDCAAVEREAIATGDRFMAWRSGR
jgi:hypothetical protein